jgi:tetratricopeptide (TPR) repeat protein
MTKAALLAEAAAVLERHLSWHPDDKGGDGAALTLGSVLLDAGEYARAERVSRSAAARHPGSRFQEGFDYTTAFARFAQRKYAEALAMCDRLETFDYGSKVRSGAAAVRDRAILMKAQIHHAKGELDQALANYRKVKGRSPDAERTVAFLEREAISMPETTVAPLAKPAEVELEHQGVAEAHVRVYKVDLTMLALRRKNLADPAAVEVAGIRPVLEKTFKLDVPNAKRRERQKLVLDLKDPGAYLVGVKAGDFFAGGLLLRSDLAMVVQEEGTVRVNVTHAATGAFQEGVKVTVVARDSIDTLRTDLRGIAEAEAQRVLPVVVAEKDGHVAVYVSRTPPVVRKPMPQVMEPKAKQGDALMEQLQEANGQLEADYQGNQRRAQQGVEVERTKK